MAGPADGMDFDPLTVPAVMPVSVRRIGEGGFPTQFLLDYEQALQQWMKSNTANTNKRLTLVSAELGDVSASVETLAEAYATSEEALATYKITVAADFGTVNARVTDETTARSTADTALATSITTLTTRVGTAESAITTEASTRSSADSTLASQISTLNSNLGTTNSNLTSEATTRANADSALSSSITTVTTRVNNISATGAVYLTSKATPAGATAAYGWYLTAGNAYAGMEALALSGGGSAIGFSANQFRFVDSGTAVAVWTYSGGKFQFTGQVAIDGGLTLNGTIVNAAAATRAFTQGVGSSSSSMGAAVSITCRGASQVLVVANFNGLSGYYAPLSTGVGVFRIQRNGGTLQSVANNFEASGSGPSAGISFQQTCLLAVDTPPAGSNTYTCETTNGASLGGVTLAVVELSK